MKDLLYLKDEQIKDFIQLLFYAYRETFSDPKKVLSKKLFGPAHLRSLNLIERHPGISFFFSYRVHFLPVLSFLLQPVLLKLYLGFVL